jgi:hypothetical protein
MFLPRRFCQFVAGQPSSCVLIALCGVLLAFCPRSSPHSDRKVTISRDTTYLVEPLRPDGYVDYRAALNAELSQGVTPENNAVVVLWQVIGPGSFAPQDRVEYFKLLGVAPPAPSGSYFKPVSAFRIKPPPATLPPSGIDPNDPDQQFFEASQRPWSPTEFPAVAAWLQANSGPLKLVRDASSRTRYFSPIVGPDGTGLTTALFPLISDERSLAYLLEADATLNLNAGKIDEAWQDSLACHRLGRLIAQGPMLIDYLVGMSIDGIAVNIDCLVAGNDKLTADQARRFARQFAEVPPLAGVSETIRVGERFYALDTIAAIARSKNSVSATAGFGIGIWQGIPPRWAPSQRVDWNAALRRVNSSFDRMVQVTAITSPLERRNAVAAVEDDLRQMIAERTGPQLNPFGYSDRATATSTENAFAYMVLSSELAAVKADDRHLNLREMCRLAFALAAYRIDRSQYPSALSALAPLYIDAVPKDRFTGSDFHFRLETNGYVLYGSDSDGNDPPLADPAVDPLLERAGIRVPPKTDN